MYYRLDEKYALRSWKFVKHGIYFRDEPDPIYTDRETFELLLNCDAEHDIEENDAVKDLVSQGMIKECRKGEHPSEWSGYKSYEHRCVPSMNLMLTGKCNYNCRHCFNAAENADRMEEWDYDAVTDLIDQAKECGMHAITLTGGEPMLHPRFMDIVKHIYDRDMILDKLTTNGFFITEEVLDEFKDIGCDPAVKISFDGVGHHDWMRGCSGAEDKTLKAIRLCADRGFCTRAQTQVFRGNLDAMKETLLVLEDAGVSSTRIIRTTPVPRWLKNAPDGTIPMEEYFERMLELAKWYMGGDHTMLLSMWLFLSLSPKDRTYSMVMARNPEGRCSPVSPVCYDNRMMMAVTCEGNVVPCLQMSGYVADLGIKFDSLKERRLSDILREGKWLDAVCMNHHAFRKSNQKCDKCEWFGYCGGGCRALGILDEGERSHTYDYTCSDPLACLFFKGGWYDRVKQEMDKFKSKEENKMDEKKNEELRSVADGGAEPIEKDQVTADDELNKEELEQSAGGMGKPKPPKMNVWKT